MNRRELLQSIVALAPASIAPHITNVQELPKPEPDELLVVTLDPKGAYNEEALDHMTQCLKKTGRRWILLYGDVRFDTTKIAGA